MTRAALGRQGPCRYSELGPTEVPQERGNLLYPLETARNQPDCFLIF